MAFDPFTPESAGEAATQSVAAKFRPSLVARAERRTVLEDKLGWVVQGEAKLGDAHDGYRIVLDPESRRYRCSCYGSQWGEVRAARVCSHVLAVILHRKRARGAAGVGAVTSPAPPPAAVERIDLPDPRDPRFGSPPLPAWVKALRPHQWQAVVEAVAHFQAGKKVVLLDGPTGSGKTLIAELVRRELDVRAIYTATTKQLQAQLLGDFPYAKVLKGKANYPALDAPADFDLRGADRVTCDDCEGFSLCGGPPDPDDPDPILCDYQCAKREALAADLAVFNTSYLLAEANYVGRFTPEFVIADECDELEAALMGFVEVSVGPRDRARLGLDVPARKTVESAWVEWLEEAVAKAEKVARSYPEKPRDPAQIKQKKRWTRLAGKLAFVRDGFESGAWVYDHTRSDWVTFKPVTVRQHAQHILWRHAPRWLAMSATVISFDQMADELGLDDQEWAAVSVPSTFPASRRPIRLPLYADLTAKTMDQEWRRAADALVAILTKHHDDAVLAHTVSYNLTQRLFDHLVATVPDRPIFTYRDAAGREEALRLFRAQPRSVLLAPSLERGVSLNDDACRVVVIVKVPYASLGDPQVAKRLYLHGKNDRAGQLWYAVRTVRSIVQGTGRGMRHAEDSCVTYVIDKQFARFWSRNRRLFPAWWREAVDPSYNARMLFDPDKET